MHTGVDPAYGGQGIAGKLLELVVNAAKAEKVRIDPVCSYAAHAFEKREDWKNLRV